jgi:hypothetical protein
MHCPSQDIHLGCRGCVRCHDFPVLDAGPNGCHNHWSFIHHCCTRVPMGAASGVSLIMSQCWMQVPIGAMRYTVIVSLSILLSHHKHGSHWELHNLQGWVLYPPAPIRCCNHRHSSPRMSSAIINVGLRLPYIAIVTINETPP